MKVTTTVDIYNHEIDVQIDLDDIVAAIREDKDSLNAVLQSFSDFIRFWQAIPGDMWLEFNEPQCKIIVEHLGKVCDKLGGRHIA